MTQPSLSLLVLFALAATASARPVTHDAATSVLGQPNAAGMTESLTPSVRTFYNPEGIAVDPTTGKVFVADRDNHRILRFSATAAYQTFAAAEAVFGQADFVSGQPNRGNGAPSADSLSDPACLSIDAAGRLWVADSGNARVLRFDNASSKPSGTAQADAVIGQAGFTTSAPADNSTSDWGFAQPVGVAVDHQGRLWVSDAMIPRILRFDNAATLSGDVPANGYLGETEGEAEEDPSDPTTFDSATVLASSLGAEGGGLSVDAAGRLWVADPSNHRVLCFENAAAKANGADADKVFGQAGFLSNDAGDPDTGAPTASSMNYPSYVTASPDGTIWVSDFLHSRVLGFPNAMTKPSGAAAGIVLGQANFVSGDAPAPYSARTLGSPAQIAVGREGSLLVVEYSEAARVVRYSDPVALVAPRTAKASKRGIVTIRGRTSGAALVQYRVVGQKGGYRNVQGTVVNWNARVTKLKRKRTNVFVSATAFDGRKADAVVQVRKPMPKKKRKK